MTNEGLAFIVFAVGMLLLMGIGMNMVLPLVLTGARMAWTLDFWDTPRLFSNVKEAGALLDGPIGDKIRAKLREKGLVGLVYWGNGFRNLTNSKRPHQQDGRPRRHQAASDAEQRVFDQLQNPWRERYAHGVFSAVQRPGNQHRGRPVKPVQHHLVQQFL